MKKNPIKRNILLNPGPVTTTDTVKYAQVIPDICPREEEFGKMMKQIRKDLVRVVKGDDNYTSVLFAGSGTAMMDACVNSIVPRDKKIAIINNGAYGERLVKIANSYGIPIVEISFKWGKTPDLKKIEEALGKNKDIACVAIIHHETTTGMLNPIKEIGDIVKKNNCIFIVDTVSSFAGIPINIKDCKIDFMFSTSNKCIQGMAGLSFVICRKDELEKTKKYIPRSFYLNLFQQYDYFEKKGEMRFTPPVQVIYALKQAIKEYFEEGGKSRYKRYAENWQALRKGLKEIGFRFLLKERQESRLLMTIIEPLDSNYDFTIMHDLLYKRGFTIYPGKLYNLNTFRLAVIGDLRVKDILDFIKALKSVLTEMGVELPVKY
jgi:2-aminoethylphosphonate aminotransferase